MLLDVLDEALLEAVRAALTEDIGSGDVTAALIPESAQARAHVRSRESAVLCGTAWFDAVFAELDSHITIDWAVRDGTRIAPDQRVCSLAGPARAILTGERTALNFLQTLSGTASCARRYADEVADLPVRILDTRKTLPGLRVAQKYAVRVGGCHNHRMGLYDAILIKENHISSAGSIRQAIAIARAGSPNLAIEVEVENESQIRESLDAGANRLLLDNFTIEALAEAVKQVAGRAELEASGGISLENLRAVAATGIDYISIGALTKNLQATDYSMVFTD
jgi:nicotinate-nucleotide pyrophosphorylase (carboxylating)